MAEKVLYPKTFRAEKALLEQIEVYVRATKDPTIRTASDLIRKALLQEMGVRNPINPEHARMCQDLERKRVKEANLSYYKEMEQEKFIDSELARYRSTGG